MLLFVVLFQAEYIYSGLLRFSQYLLSLSVNPSNKSNTQIKEQVFLSLLVNRLSISNHKRNTQVLFQPGCVFLVDCIYHPNPGLCVCLPPGGSAHLHRATRVSRQMFMFSLRLQLLENTFFWIFNSLFFFLILKPPVPPRNECRASLTSPSWPCSSCTCWRPSLVTSLFTVRCRPLPRGQRSHWSVVMIFLVNEPLVSGSRDLIFQRMWMSSEPTVWLTLCVSLWKGGVESELLHTYSRVGSNDVLILCVRLAVLVAVTLTVPVVLFPVRSSFITDINVAWADRWRSDDLWWWKRECVSSFWNFWKSSLTFIFSTQHLKILFLYFF